MKKPSKYWWARLTHKQKKQFKKNAEIGFLKRNIKITFKTFISSFFIWEDSKEGHQYWNTISQKHKR